MASSSHLGSAPPSFSGHSLHSSPAPAWDHPLFLLCCRSLSLAFLRVWGCADPLFQSGAPALEHFGCGCSLWCPMPSAALSLLHLCHLSRRDGEISMSLPSPSLLCAAFPSTAGYETSVREKPGPDVARGCCSNGSSPAWMAPVPSHRCGFLPSSQPGLSVVLSLLPEEHPSTGRSLEELPWCCVPVAELSQGVFSPELARAAAQEILVAPLLQSLLFGARAGFGLAHILQCLTVLEGCGGVARAAGGAQSSKLGLCRVHA